MLPGNGKLTAMRRNLILASLPERELRTVGTHLEEVELPFGKVMSDPDQELTHAYFIISGVASLIVNLSDGASVEVASVGREALVGAGGLLRLPREPHTTLIQAEGSAYKIAIPRLQKLFNDCRALREAILRNLYIQTSQMAQTAACNRVHEVEERMARWLLMLQDLVGSDRLHLTHEFLAIMLGTRRTTVTLAAGLLQKDGIINYKRGKVHILDRNKLEAVACECYADLREFVASIPPTQNKN
jgi:CRP-like cAMP-binding protein